MKRIVPYIVALVSLVSCEYQFDVVSSDKTSMLFVESIVGLDDAASDIKVLKTIPVGTPKESSLEVRGLSAELAVDGAPVALSKVEGQPFLMFPKVEEGAGELALKMKAKGLPEISARTEVPERPQVEARAEVFPDRIKWTLIGGKESQNYAICLNIRGGEGEWKSVTVYDDYTGGSYLEMLSSQLKTVYWQTYYYSYKFILLRGEDFENGEFIFASDPEEGDYQLLVYSLSDSAYGYLNARYNQESNILGILGLSPPNFAYSNVSGGYGVLGAASRKEILLDVELQK